MDSSTASAVRVMDTVLNAKCGSAFDWAAVISLCDMLNACNKKDAETAVHILCVRLDTAQRARTKNMTGPGASAAEERTVRALMLLDCLVKNVAAARTIAANKNTLALLEKIADLQHKTAAAKTARSKRKAREQSRGSSSRSGMYRLADEDEEEESMSILDPSVHDDDDDSGDSAAGKKTDDGSMAVGGAEDWAMRILQAWGMLHPAEFPLFLKAMEKWKKAGVVFPQPSPEDLLPLPKISQTSKPAKQAPAPAPKDPDAEAKRVMTEVIQQLSTVACDTAALLAEMCNAANASAAEGEDEELDTVELRATLVAQCKNMRTAMTAVVEAALSGKSLPPFQQGGPRVLVYKTGANEAGREAAVAFLLGVIEKLENAIQMNDDCAKQKARIMEERKKQPPKPKMEEPVAAAAQAAQPAPAAAPTASTVPIQPTPATSSSSSDVFNPFNLPENVIIPQSPTSSIPVAAAAAVPTTTSTSTSTSTSTAAAATSSSSTSYLDELLGTAPTQPTTTPTTPKRDALTELLFS